MNSIWRWCLQWGIPHVFMTRSRRWVQVLAVLALGLLAVGSIWSLGFAPADYQQGETYRILYVHVPAAWMSLMIYGVMSVAAIVYWVWKIRMASVLLIASAGLGAMFTAVALVTGALWGKPMWGTYWIWDARLTSELILLFIYLGIIALHQAFERPEQARSAVALMTLIGSVNIPIIHYSVQWWNTLHQGASVSVMNGSAMHPDMLWPLLVMAFAFKAFYGWLVLVNMQTQLVCEDQSLSWVKKEVEHG